MKCKNSPTFLRHLFVCVLVFGLNPLGAFASEYFVATTGNDSNPGTIGSPFLTLEKAASVMVAGDTMYIRGGRYQRTAWFLDVPSGGGSWEKATIIKNYNHEEVIITPQDPSQNGTDVIRLVSGRSYIIFDGLILDGLRDGTTNGGRHGFRFGPSTTNDPNHHVRLINMEIRYVYGVGILTNDGHHLEFINTELHHAAHNLPPDDPHGLFRPYGIYMSSGNNLMLNCDIHHNEGYGINQYSGHAFQPHNNVYIGNKIHHNGRLGFMYGRGQSLLFMNNLVYENGNGNLDPDNVRTSATARGGMYLTGGGAWNGKIYNNTFYNNNVRSLYITELANAHTISNNIFYETQHEYVIFIRSGTPGITITHNLLYNSLSSSRLIIGPAKMENNLSNMNPGFLNPAQGGFKLQSESPAIGKGVFLNEVKVDIDQVQRNQPYDIGAYAFTGSSLGAPKNLAVIGKK